jgi:hypothetical protein
MTSYRLFRNESGKFNIQYKTRWWPFWNFLRLLKKHNRKVDPMFGSDMDSTKAEGTREEMMEIIDNLTKVGPEQEVFHAN